jgi:hypothetical protein
VTKHLFVGALVSVVMLAPLGARQAPAKEELKLQLPKPMFIGTPTNIKSANLEVITGKSRGPFMVPVGTKLLSLKRPVKASDMQPVIGECGWSPTARRRAATVTSSNWAPASSGSRSI